MSLALTPQGLLHPRILKNCLTLYADGHYKHAAQEAMTQVERAIKEKTGFEHRYGVNLATRIFGHGHGIKLRVPFGSRMQAEAERLFAAAFSYYRNYATHEGDNIDEMCALRVMVLATELLELVGASLLSSADIGGAPGLVSEGVFASVTQVAELLKFLDGQPLPDDVCDGFYEDLGTHGFTESQLQSLLDCGLVEYRSVPVDDPTGQTDSVGFFHLTALGEEVSDNPESAVTSA
ncbi:MAG: TIGR02391 family protein [Deltaproteobacteria bacterium]|nr:TIGR02391 family protein [Deltaproteobacteria bacterium]MBI3390983.1 TIGR02391 family protein [Deltaproteobacteria bacterium]